MPAGRTGSRRKRQKNESAPQVVSSTRALAAIYDVTPTVVRDKWLKAEGFPGVRGVGRRGGRYVVEEVDRWLVARDATRNTGVASKAVKRACERLGVSLSKGGQIGEGGEGDRAKKLRAERMLLELKLQREQGSLIDRIAVQKEVERVYTILLQTVRQLPNMLGEVLPVDMPVEIKADFVRRAEAQVKNALDGFAELLPNAG